MRHELIEYISTEEIVQDLNDETGFKLFKLSDLLTESKTVFYFPDYLLQVNLRFVEWLNISSHLIVLLCSQNRFLALDSGPVSAHQLIGFVSETEEYIIFHPCSHLLETLFCEAWVYRVWGQHQIYIWPMEGGYLVCFRKDEEFSLWFCIITSVLRS